MFNPFRFIDMLRSYEQPADSEVRPLLLGYPIRLYSREELIPIARGDYDLAIIAAQGFCKHHCRIGKITLKQVSQ